MGNTGGRTGGGASIPLDMGEEDAEEQAQEHTKEGSWILWAHLETEGSPGSLEVTATLKSRKSCTLIMLINRGEGNQAQVCAPSSPSTKAKPLGSTAFSKGKGDQ